MKIKTLFSVLTVILFMFLAIPTVVAEQNNKETVVFTVQPEMHCKNCENKIKTNLRFEKGVSNITTDVKGKTVTVVYDTNKTDPEKLVAAFAKIGYKATAVKK